MTEHYNRSSVGSFAADSRPVESFRVREDATQERPNSEDAKQLCRAPQSGHLLSSVGSLGVDWDGLGDGECFEGLGAVMPLDKAARVHKRRALPLGRALEQCHDSIRVRVRERL